MALETTANQATEESVVTFDSNNFQLREIEGCMQKGVPVNLVGFIDYNSPNPIIEELKSSAEMYGYSSQVIGEEEGVRVEWRKD
jgi:hypothetical protein